jgi:ubiquinone/menaquinone biosynthesis C-methylase UbiE
MIDALVSPVAAPAYGGSFDSGLSAQNRVTWRQESTLVRRHGLMPGLAAASVGCGCGHFETALAADLRLYSLSALDRDPEAIELAEAGRRGLPIHFEVGDATRLPWADESFDFTICRHALQTMPAPVRKEALRELVRVTRPGGRIYITNEKNSHCTGAPDARAIDRAFRLVAELWEEFGMDIECGPEQAGWLRQLGLEDLRVDTMTVSSLDDPEGFAEVAESWRSTFVQMALDADWRGERMRSLNAGLLAYRQAALEGYATWPIWVASARRPC